MMRRRTFLALAAGGVAISLASGAKVFRLGSRIPEYRRPRLDQKSPTGKLSSMEMATIIALAEVLIPTDKTSEQINSVLETHINHRTLTDNGYLNEYRKAALLLDETTRAETSVDGKFANLSLSERQNVLAEILWKYRQEQSRFRQLEATFSSSQTLAFRRFVVKDILEAFVRKLPGEAWTIVGYKHYPGVPADPRAYSRPLSSTASSDSK